jgi:hypothetical protein
VAQKIDQKYPITLVKLSVHFQTVIFLNLVTVISMLSDLFSVYFAVTVIFGVHP